MLEIKNIVAKINAFEGLVSKLYIAKETSSELEDMSIEIKIQGEKE